MLDMLSSKSYAIFRPVLILPLDLSVEFKSVFISLSRLSEMLEIPLILRKISRAVLEPWCLVTWSALRRYPALEAS